MADQISALFQDFAARFAAGQAPDVGGYLDQAGLHADALAAMIERFTADALQLDAVPPPNDEALPAVQELIGRVDSAQEEDGAPELDGAPPDVEPELSDSTGDGGSDELWPSDSTEPTDETVSDDFGVDDLA